MIYYLFVFGAAAHLKTEQNYPDVVPREFFYAIIERKMLWKLKKFLG